MELAEINILCLYECIDNKGYVKQCFSNCEKTLTRLMLSNEFDLVPTTEFFISEYKGSNLIFLLVTVSCGILIVCLALCIVGRKVYKSLKKKHLDQYHKMKSKKKATQSGCRRNKEYRKMRKFMRNVMKSGGSERGKVGDGYAINNDSS